MRKDRRAAQAGFSLVEVIAALVILSIGASAAFSWLIQSVDRLARLRREEQAQMVRLEVLDYLRAINPSARPEGAVQIAGYAFSWKSRPLREEIDALNALRAPGIYRVSLHEVTAHVALPASDASEGFDIVLPVAGFRQVGEAGRGPLAVP